ncbi:hypothetical protein [Thiorhodovibrio litoralis]|uniref:hypothetical protein n=1 Tax=Thiorhodovibrio litoralis TaxID=2952932 RepID=UPI002B2621BB|nr:hypothetical protein [Thiorhodovibrio litoralis]
MGAVVIGRAASGSGWQQLDQDDTRFPTVEDNGGRWSIELYKLTSETQVKKDWYRFDFRLTSTPKYIGCKSKGSEYHCGWWTDRYDFAAQLSGATLDEWLPRVKNQEHTATFTIGLNLGGAKPHTRRLINTRM